MRAPGRVLGAVAAAAGLVLLVVGVPTVLVAAFGNPYPPEGIAWDAMLTDNAVVGLFVVLAWLAWAQVMVCVLVEVVAQLRRVPSPRLPIALPGQQQLVSVLVHAVLAGVIAGTVAAPHDATAATVDPASTAPTITRADRPSAHAPEVASSTAGHVAADQTAEASPTTTDADTEAADDAGGTTTVRRGDSLWSLAETHLGDPLRWTDIRDLNRGRAMADGAIFTTGDRLEPGWVLSLPGSDAPRSADPRTAPTTGPDRGRDVTVEPGDSLSAIAESELGDQDRWRTIWRENRGAGQADGQRLTDPDLIQPGWRLHVPQADPATPAPTPAPDPSPEPVPEPADRAPAPQAPTQEQTAPHQTAPGQIAPDEQRLPRGGDGRSTDGGGRAGEADGSVQDASEQDGTGLPAWVMPGLVGAGGLLAGAVLLQVRRRRAAQHRARRPGRSLPIPTSPVDDVERSVLASGAPNTTVVEQVDRTLRDVAAATLTAGAALPRLAAVEVTDAVVAVHLRAPAELPEGAGWSVTQDRLVWVISREAVPAGAVDDPVGARAPWPLLVTVGHDRDGSVWLLNLEGTVVSLAGAPDRAADLARFIAADIACNPWSARTWLDLVGVASEIAPIDSSRITVHDEAEAAARPAVAETVRTLDRVGDYDVDVPTARARDDDPDLWPSRLLIAHVSDLSAGDALHQLGRLVETHEERSATAVLLQTPHVVDEDPVDSAIGPADGDAADGERPPTTGLVDTVQVVVDASGRLKVPAVGLELTAVGLTAEEAAGCAALLAQAEEPGDAPVPDSAGERTWEQMSTVTGSLRAQYRVGRGGQPMALAESVLPSADATYTAAAATTVEDLDTLAPRVTQQVRQEVADADPDLDADLVAWRADWCRRPRLRLLGPVEVWTSGLGRPLAKRKPYHVELLAYLHLSRYGRTAAEVEHDFGQRGKTAMSGLRHWLGTDENDDLYLPDALRSPAAQARGVGVYEVLGVLSDVDLFRRLRVRGESRGAAGMGDLVRALQLVAGRPFDQLRTEGWAWLLEDGERLDRYMTTGVADVAHLVVTQALADGDLDLARTAVGISTLAAPDEETARLDLAAVLDAQGHRDQARAVLRDDVCNRDDDGLGPTRLPDRTEQIIAAKQWLETEVG